MDDATPFWKLSKRPPVPVRFNAADELHLKFVVACARLYADVFGVVVDAEALAAGVEAVLGEFEASEPQWRPSQKRIETDENKKRDEVEKERGELRAESFENASCAEVLKRVCKGDRAPALAVLHFEKDVDANGHIDFIYAAANLSASMYVIEKSDRLKLKKVSGRIVPAIATTTSCIAGFVAVELVKVLNGEKNLEAYSNLFVNLALSKYLIPEPGACERKKIVSDCYVSLWDRWTVRGWKDMTLRQFNETAKNDFKLTVSGVMNGAKSIYLPVLPGHVKRLNETMLKLIKGSPGAAVTAGDYVDLTLTYVECDEIDNASANNMCPPIRYYFMA